MTIDYRILVGSPVNSTQHDAIQTIIKDAFHEINTTYNKWNPDSELSRLNRLKKDEQAILSPQLYKFLQRTDKLVKLTDGRFDPTVEPLQQLWKNRLEAGQTPSEQEIIALAPSLGWDKIHFTDGIFYKTDNRTQLDLGGIAKGYCVDLITERLNAAGFYHLYVEWGGEIKTTGHHPESRPWRIYISKFGDTNPENAVDQFNLINQAIATSGDYYQYWVVDQKTYCHIFDPIKLRPLLVESGTVASASLVADDCMTADALAKVLMLFDSVEEAQQWIRKVQETYPRAGCWIVTR